MTEIKIEKEQRLNEIDERREKHLLARMSGTGGILLNDAEDKKTPEEHARTRIIDAKLQSQKLYEKYMKLEQHDKALFFLARTTAFDETLRFL